MSTQDRHYQIIRKPLITEKATDDMARRNAYCFKVPRDAGKIEIRQAVEKLFEVNVKSVNTLIVPSKRRRRGYSVGSTPRWKKAMVTLAEGQTIEVL